VGGGAGAERFGSVRLHGPPGYLPTLFAIFHGTQTGPGGPVPSTEKKIAADYVYHMVFDGERIKHITKIWNDTVSMQQLGWG